MDMRRLEVFCKVVELKSFTRAADAVLLSQPTVSEHIRLLEESVGEKLLDRLGREILPTGAGEILYRYARRILQLRDEAQQSIDQYRGRLSGHLTLGASTIPGTYLLPRLLESFHERFREVRLTLQIAGSAQVADAILQGALECGIIGSQSRDGRLESRAIPGDELLLALPARHPWCGRAAVAPEELLNEPFIQREPGSGTRQVTEEIFVAEGLPPGRLNVVAEMGSSEAVRQGVKSGIGVAILSSLAIEEDLITGSIATVPLEGFHFERPFYLVQRRNRQLSPLAQAFTTHLLERSNER